MYIKRPTINQVIEIKEVLFLYIENFDIRQNTVLSPTARLWHGFIGLLMFIIVFTPLK